MECNLGLFWFGAALLVAFYYMLIDICGIFYIGPKIMYVVWNEEHVANS